MIPSQIQDIECQLANERDFSRRQDLFRKLWHLRQKPTEDPPAFSPTEADAVEEEQSDRQSPGRGR